jgi:GAF domain-containing protein
MSHDLHIDSGVSKEEIYAQLLPQLTALTEGESDMIACMANLCAALHQTFGWLWTGFYRAKGDELVLGPFQGPLACVRIKRGKGVCGTAWIKEETIVVPDVEKFPGHIACSSLSRSEIVVPIKNSSGETIAVLDIDSEQTDTFDDTDAHWLGKVADLLSKCR